MVLINNGFGKFHLAAAAAEVSRRGKLVGLITGAYPGRFSRQAARLLGVGRIGKVQRFLERAEAIAAGKMYVDWLSELLHVFGLALTRQEFTRQLGEGICAVAMRMFGTNACRYVLDAHARGARIYHFRSGFGLRSARLARRKGMFTICDHSIAHPLLIETLIKNPDLRAATPIDRYQLRGIWRPVLEDIEHADVVLVNSEFVKSTFQIADPLRTRSVFVIYQGLDENFRRYVEGRQRVDPFSARAHKAVFAGTLEPRKGSEILLKAMLRLQSERPDFQLTVIGRLAPQNANVDALIKLPTVRYLGVKSRAELAEIFLDTQLLIFPTHAEGSARVVFEALAAGCYVITTKNAGSVVVGGESGALIPPCSDALVNAVKFALEHPALLAELSPRNRALVSEAYLQRNYGDELSCLYSTVLASHAQ